MSAGYHIKAHAPQAMLVVQLEGFFSCEEIESLRHDLRQAIHDLRAPPGDHVSLFDIRKCKIQSQDIVSAFREMSATKGVTARRLAIVVGDSLMRMQLGRIIGPERNASYFDDVDAAKRWLLKTGDLNSGAMKSEIRLGALSDQMHR